MSDSESDALTGLGDTPINLVRSERLELSWLSPQRPQRCASTNFATTAKCLTVRCLRSIRRVTPLIDLAGVVGFEPTNVGFRIRCLNRTWRYPNQSGAVGETRTLMALTTATSTLRVYQFRHDRGPNCSPLMCIRRSEVTSRGGVFYLGISFVGALLGFSLPDIPYSWDAGCSTVDKTPPAG